MLDGSEYALQEDLEQRCMNFLRDQPDEAQRRIASCFEGETGDAAKEFARSIYEDMAPRFNYVAFGVLKKRSNGIALECFLGFEEGQKMLSLLGGDAGYGFFLEPLRAEPELPKTLRLPVVVESQKTRAHFLGRLKR